MNDEEDRFRWCVHCGADCWPDAEDQEHASNCPFSTGLWPVELDPGIEVARWVRWECEDVPDEIRELAEKADAGAPVCAECSVPFKPGDYYMLRSEDTGDVENRPFIGVMICIGCAAGVGS